MFLTFLLAIFTAESQEVLITGYLDSPCENADGRTVEIYVNGTIDFTEWDLVRQANGGGYSSNIDLTDLGELTNTFAYITNDATVLEDEFGITANVITNGDISDNGDDAFQLTDASANVIDRFGEDMVDGTGTDWEHEDSYYYRNSGTSANAGTFDVANWTFGEQNLLDGQGICNGGDALSTLVPFGSYASVLTPPGETCDAPIEITSLPYSTSDNTANYGNDYNNGDSPCSSDYLSGDDAVYSFTPATDMVVNILMSNIGGSWSGIHVLDACLDSSPNCVAFEGNSTSSDRNLEGVLLSGGTTYYIIISTWAFPQSTTYDLSIEEVLCPNPSAVAVDNIALTSADVSWTENGSATEWEVLYGETGFDPEAGGATINDTDNVPGETMSALVQNTTYDVYVKAICGIDGESEPIGPTTFTTLASCPKPTDLTANNITSGTSDINWTAGGDETEWEILYGETGFDPATEGTSVADNDGTLGETLNDLEANTTYELYVRAICADDDQSEWSLSTTFTTECTTLTPTYFQGFDNYLPECWKEAGAGNPTNGASDFGNGLWFSETFLNNSENSDAVSINLYTTNSEGWVISPNIDLSNGGPYELKYLVGLTGYASTGEPEGNGMGSDDEIQILISEDNGQTWSNLKTYNQDSYPSHTGDTEYIDLSSYTGTIKIAFWGTDGTIEDTEDYEFFIDDFQVRPIPNCPEPSNVMITDLTVESATVTWTPNGEETEWEILYGEAGFDPETEGTSVSDNDGSLGENLENLTPDTDYEVYVRAICGTGDESVWTSPVSFTTNCETITTFPYLEDFDDITTPDLPTCWSYLDENAEGNTSNDIWQTYTGDGINDTQAAGLYTNGNGGDNDDYLVSPQFTLTGNEQVRFSVKAESEFEPNDFKVMLSTTGNDAASFTEELLPLTEVSNAEEYEQYTIDLDAYTGDVYIAIYVPSGGQDGWYLYVDKFIVRTIPTCPEPTDIAIDEITDVSANVTWTAGGDETEWTVVYGELGFDPTTAGTENTVNVTGGTPEATIEGLTPETDYEVYVQANCGENDNSEWTGPESFYSWYCVSEPSSNDGSGITNAQLADTDFPNEDVTYNSFTATPVDIQQETLTNIQITFATGLTYDTNIWIDFNDDFVFDESELVYSGESTNNNPTTLDASFTLLADTALGSHAMRIGAADGGQATPNPCYNDAYGVTLDFIVNILPGPCPPPSDITVNASDYYADVTWTENGDATAWTLTYGPVGFNPDETGTVITDNDGVPGITIDNLEPETQYDIYIIANCDEDSSLVGPVTFETIPNTCLAPTDIQINQIVGPTAEVTWVENGTATEWEIEYGSADFEPGTGAGTIVTDNDGTLGETLTGLDPETEYGVYVRAICEGDGTSNWSPVEMFTTMMEPCETPTDIFISNETENSVDVNWTENGDATQWEILYGETGFDPENGGTLVMDNDGETGITIDELEPGSTYDIYVRAICGENNMGEWSVVENFMTTLSLKSVNFSDFTYYPNPINGKLHLQSSMNIEEVAIYNLLGQRVINHKPNDLKSTIDVTRLQAGAYLMKVTINGYAKTFKLVKE